MKNQVNLIEDRKLEITKGLKRLRNKYVGCIYNGLMNKKSIRDIHKEIRNISIESKYKSPKLESYVKKLAEISAKKVKNETEQDVIGLVLFKLFDRKKVFTKTNTITYDEGKEYEAEKKADYLDFYLGENRMNKKVFYLCSGHRDCAVDHLNFQSRIYIDEKWESIITDEELKRQVGIYIDLNDIKTYQWVIGKPVWLITRPNCRHYFKAIDTNEVLKKPLKKIIRNHKMFTKKGDRKLTQSIRHDTSKAWYTESNVKSIIERYKERLEYHKILYASNPRIQKVKRAIEKDKLLIAKWQQFYKERFGK